MGPRDRFQYRTHLYLRQHFPTPPTQDAITRHGQMGTDSARLGKLTRSEAEGNRCEFALPGFLEKAPPPPIDRASTEDVLNCAHVNTPVLQARDTVVKTTPQLMPAG
jgi:hypothetical protein